MILKYYCFESENPLIEKFMNEVVVWEFLLLSYPNRFQLTLEQMQLSRPRINVFDPTARKPILILFVG